MPSFLMKIRENAQTIIMVFLVLWAFLASAAAGWVLFRLSYFKSAVQIKSEHLIECQKTNEGNINSLHKLQDNYDGIIDILARIQTSLAVDEAIWKSRQKEIEQSLRDGRAKIERALQDDDCADRGLSAAVSEQLRFAADKADRAGALPAGDLDTSAPAQNITAGDSSITGELRSVPGDHSRAVLDIGDSERGQSSDQTVDE